MCTNFALYDGPGARDLAKQLHVDPAGLLYGNNFKPGSTISIVRDGGETREVTPAIWWLYLKQTPDGLKPHPDYFSVNTNHRKLSSKAEFRQSRCIIPVSAFAESQDGKRPHLLQPESGSAMAFGGLYKTWTDRVTGERVSSASIITLAGHPALADIHRKSVPLWLPESAWDAWLSPEEKDTTQFGYLLEPSLREDLLATPIDRVGTKSPVGESFLVKP